MTDVEFAIIGGGPTGIGAARRLLEHGRNDVLLLEREPVFGGLAGSEIDAAGFTWDYGCHVQHSHYGHFDRAMADALGEDGWNWHVRASWVWLDGRYVPYPFQNNIHRLDADDCARCLEGLREADRLRDGYTAPPADFREWTTRTFGEGICELFLRPYNFKVWAYPLETMNATWVGDRVAVPDVARVERNVAERRDDVSWGPNSRFRFPRQGGTGAVWRALARALPDAVKRPGATVVAVDLPGHRLTLSNGETIGYRHLVSSMPLDLLARVSRRADLVEAAAGLVYSSTHVVGLGLNGTAPDHLADKSWVYYPEPAVPFYRVTCFSNYSAANVPDPSRHWSLMMEVAESPAKPVDGERVVEDVVRGCLAVGLIGGRDQVCDVFHKRLERGYPTPSLSRDPALAVLLPAFEEHDVLSRGRFGAWKYEASNQDHSFMQGVEAADRLVGAIDPELGPEPTVRRPHVVNARHRP